MFALSGSAPPRHFGRFPPDPFVIGSKRRRTAPPRKARRLEMRYMLLIYGDESGWSNLSEADQQAEMAKWFSYTEEMRSAGISDQGDALQPTATATSVRTKNGEPIVTDGPFAETKEQLRGYYLLDVANLDEAIKWASKCPAAPTGTVELRPIMEFPDAP